jgi:ribosomal protein L11 methyltransferase
MAALMADGTARWYPALEVTWPASPTEIDRELLLAAVDDDMPTALEETPTGARVFFPSAAARDRAASRIAGVLPVACSPIEVSDERWAERSQESLQPVRVGDFVIDTKPGLIPGFTSTRYHTRFLVIRPSMGFGTGHHASTRLCLQLLQVAGGPGSSDPGGPLSGLSVLDVGTGSGILAIAAAMLGAASVRAIDNDADAIQSARDNLALNGVERSVALRHGDLARLADDEPASLVTANLTGAHLIASASVLSGLAAPDGRLILGGVQSDEEPDVRRAFAALGWNAASRAEEEGWIGLILQRR